MNQFNPIELQTHDPTKVLRLVDIEGSLQEHYFTCILVVRSGAFSCERRFGFDESHFPDALAAMRKMVAGEPGVAKIKARWDDDFVEIAMNDMGHVVVTGEVFERNIPEQSLRFGFITDQTVLGPFVSDLSELVIAE